MVFLAVLLVEVCREVILTNDGHILPTVIVVVEDVGGQRRGGRDWHCVLGQIPILHLTAALSMSGWSHD